MIFTLRLMIAFASVGTALANAAHGVTPIMQSSTAPIVVAQSIPQSTLSTPRLPTVPRHFGIIAGVSQWHLRLREQFWVDLHPYTVIIPTDAVLRPGMHVLVYGHLQPNEPLNRPTIDASTIVVESDYH